MLRAGTTRTVQPSAVRLLSVELARNVFCYIFYNLARSQCSSVSIFSWRQKTVLLQFFFCNFEPKYLFVLSQYSSELCRGRILIAKFGILGFFQIFV